jgi:hypothetical protein
MIERSNGIDEHGHLVTSSTKEDAMTERSEGIDKTSPLVAPPAKEGT